MVCSSVIDYIIGHCSMTSQQHECHWKTHTLVALSVCQYRRDTIRQVQKDITTEEANLFLVSSQLIIFTVTCGSGKTFVPEKSRKPENILMNRCPSL